MSVGISILIFFVSIIALVAEFVLYMIMGIGASFSGGISALSGTVFFFVGLMVVTAAIGVFAPCCAIIGAISKNKSIANKIFSFLVLAVGLIYFFGIPVLSKKVSSNNSSVAPQETVVHTDAVNQNPEGKWISSIDTNPIDDSKTVVLALTADSGKSMWGNPVRLIVRCQSGKTDLYISWEAYLGEEADVLTRIGTNSATTSRWSMSTDSKATFHTEPIPFLKEMLKSDKLVAQITPYNENPITAIFDISGLENAIKPVKETCGWDSPTTANPEHQNYTQEVRRKILERAYLYIDNPNFEGGTLALKFVLFSNGELKEVAIDEKQTQANDYLRSVGIRSVRESSPFSPFPENFQSYPELNFNIIFSFEVSP